MAHFFICTDSLQSTILDAVAGALVAQGHCVTRGPANPSGARKHYSEAECRALLAAADIAVFTNRHEVSRAVMMAAPRLRGICFPVTGVESLDLEAATELGIIVGHGRVHANAVGMAESTVMLILMLLYEVEGRIGLLRDAGWGPPSRYARSLYGKTVGLVGFGRIAREIAARLTAFQVEILAVAPRARPDDLPPGVRQVDLPTLLRDSDVVSIHTGLTPETRHMIGAAELALMKPGAVIVNTGRGEVIDEPALVETLAAGRIFGAALDTFAVEPLPPDSALRSLNNVILTPHCVGHTVEGIAAFEPALLENVRRILAGDLPLYCKNPDAEPAWRRRLLAAGALKAAQ